MADVLPSASKNTTIFGIITTVAVVGAIAFAAAWAWEKGKKTAGA